MTDMKDEEPLPAVAQKFILHWGEMGTRWGINRTVAQAHAILFISERPLSADEITTLLGVARSYSRSSLKELHGAGIVSVVLLAGDPRDRFQSVRDVWETFRVVLEERIGPEI